MCLLHFNVVVCFVSFAEDLCESCVHICAGGFIYVLTTLCMTSAKVVFIYVLVGFLVCLTQLATISSIYIY